MDEKKVLKNSEPSHIEEDATCVMASQTISQTMEHKTPAVLSLIAGPRQWMGRVWPLEDSHVAGRDKKNSDIFIPHRSLSRKHALFSFKDKENQIQDLGSTNGTFLNDEKLEASKTYSLKNNDILKLGFLVFKFFESGHIEARSALKAHNQMYMDPLCQIHNRKYMDVRGQELFSLYQQTALDLSFSVFDLDHFKKINDKYGHLGGDFILSCISSLTKTMIRNSDLFCRIGGEEFALMFECNLETTQRLMEKIRSKVAEEVFEFNKQKIKVTLSAGITSLRPEDQTWQDLYKRADQALYESKNKGRNQISLG